MKKILFTSIILVLTSFGLNQANADGHVYKEVLDYCEDVEKVEVVTEIKTIEKQISELQKQLKELEKNRFEEVCYYKKECNIERFDTTKEIIGCFDFITDTLHTTKEGVGCNRGGPNRRNVYNVTMQQAQNIVDAGVECEDITIFASHCNRESQQGYDGVHPDRVSYGECGITKGKWLNGVQVYNQGPIMHYQYALDSLRRAGYDYKLWIQAWNWNDNSRFAGVKKTKDYYNVIYNK